MSSTSNWSASRSGRAEHRVPSAHADRRYPRGPAESVDPPADGDRGPVTMGHDVVTRGLPDDAGLLLHLVRGEGGPEPCRPGRRSPSRWPTASSRSSSSYAPDQVAGVRARGPEDARADQRRAADRRRPRAGHRPRASRRRAAAGRVAASRAPWRSTRSGTRPARRRPRRAAHFPKNVSLLGGVLLASRDTEGQPGIAWRAQAGGQSSPRARAGRPEAGPQRGRDKLRQAGRGHLGEPVSDVARRGRRQDLRPGGRHRGAAPSCSAPPRSRTRSDPQMARKQFDGVAPDRKRSSRRRSRAGSWPSRPRRRQKAAAKRAIEAREGGRQGGEAGREGRQEAAGRNARKGRRRPRRSGRTSSSARTETRPLVRRHLRTARPEGTGGSSRPGPGS